MKAATQKTNNNNEESGDKDKAASGDECEDEDLASSEEETNNGEETHDEETDSEEEPNKEDGPDGKSKMKPRIGVIDLTNLMAATKDLTTQVSCFLLIILNRLVMPRTGFYLADKQISYAWDLEQASRIDSCKEVYEDLACYILQWKKHVRKRKQIITYLVV
jgi:hypothetical protein